MKKTPITNEPVDTMLAAILSFSNMPWPVKKLEDGGCKFPVTKLGHPSPCSAMIASTMLAVHQTRNTDPTVT